MPVISCHRRETEPAEGFRDRDSIRKQPKGEASHVIISFVFDPDEDM